MADKNMHKIEMAMTKEPLSFCLKTQADIPDIVLMMSLARKEFAKKMHLSLKSFDELVAKSNEWLDAAEYKQVEFSSDDYEEVIEKMKKGL